MTRALDTGEVVRLDDDLPWSTTTIPESAPEVGIVRLHVDQATGASVSVVRFPAGFSRPATGHYSCAEELTVLSGWLELNGRRYAAGDSDYVAPYATRASMSSGGADVLAWFSGPPRWASGPADAQAAEEHAAGTRHGPRLRVADDIDELDRDVLWVHDRSWAWLPAGVRLPERDGEPDVRRWPA